MKRATPLISVDAIEPCLPFWTDLGFSVTVTVPHGDVHGFAMLHQGSVELMYQTRASLAADLGASGAPDTLPDELADGTMTIFVEVEDIEEVLSRLGGAEVIVPRRTTFYGMDEIFVRAPCGTIVGFAQKVEEGDAD